MKRVKQNGFTLIEIAIVLLIISLLLGGVIKGQEMINSARVRSIANDLSGIETAWISFQDRYRALPGDFDKADSHIATDTKNGNGNAAVDSPEEMGAIWQQLAAAGFISGSFTGVAAGGENDTECAKEVCPTNPYNGFYKIAQAFDGVGDTSSSYQLSTGGNIPVEVMYELDLKIDDGDPNSGRLRALGNGACVDGAQWNVAEGEGNCTAVWLL